MKRDTHTRAQADWSFRTLQLKNIKSGLSQNWNLIKCKTFFHPNMILIGRSIHEHHRFIMFSKLEFDTFYRRFFVLGLEFCMHIIKFQSIEIVANPIKMYNFGNISAETY